MSTSLRSFKHVFIKFRYSTGQKFGHAWPFISMGTHDYRIQARKKRGWGFTGLH